MELSEIANILEGTRPWNILEVERFLVPAEDVKIYRVSEETALQPCR